MTSYDNSTDAKCKYNVMKNIYKIGINSTLEYNIELSFKLFLVR